MLSFVLPTRDRPDELGQTAAAVAALGLAGAELVVVDNASSRSHELPRSIRGMPVRLIRLDENLGAAARNVGAEAAVNPWLVMLDDDSAPIDGGIVDAVRGADRDVGAIAGDIVLPDGSRERGGLPEVFVGCGVAIRRELFLGLGGYDPSFGYYAEEYDLCAKLIAAGSRVGFDQRFRVLHRKVGAGRDFGLILQRLVRNNGWVIARHAPSVDRGHELGRMLGRYASIAQREGVIDGFARGHAELRRSIDRQTRTPMSDDHWARFTGLAAVREALAAGLSARARTAAIVAPGKGEHTVREAVAERGLIIVGDASSADVRIIGTLSPGPMIDAAASMAGDARLVIPWPAADRMVRRPVAAA